MYNLSNVTSEQLFSYTKLFLVGMLVVVVVAMIVLFLFHSKDRDIHVGKANIKNSDGSSSEADLTASSKGVSQVASRIASQVRLYGRYRNW